jgi:hypothetical protein
VVTALYRRYRHREFQAELIGQSQVIYDPLRNSV